MKHEGYGELDRRVPLTPAEFEQAEIEDRALGLWQESAARTPMGRLRKIAKEMGVTPADAQALVNRAMDRFFGEFAGNIGRVVVEEHLRIMRSREAIDGQIEKGNLNAIRLDAELGREIRRMYGSDNQREGVNVINVNMGDAFDPPKLTVIEGEAEEAAE